MGGCAEGCTQPSKPPSDSRWSEVLRVASRLPWQTKVVHELAGETELGIGGDHDPVQRSACSGFCQRWCRPFQRTLL